MQPRTDEQIHRGVLEALERDSYVQHTRIGVQVEEGIVTLAGIVPSLAIKRAACSAAHRAPGVRDVANNLLVREFGFTGLSDTDIAQGVRSALDRLEAIETDALHSTVAHGMVSLFGMVANSAQHETIVAAVREVEGVLVITDMLRVVADEPSGSGRAAAAGLRTNAGLHTSV